MTVVAPWAQQTGDGLARYLGELWGTDVTVVLDSVASAGARRRNVLFSADDGNGPRGFVATIVPNPALQLQDFMLEPNMIRIAEAGGVPVPHVVGATLDESYVGGPFFLTGRIEGETVPRRVLRSVQTYGIGHLLAEQTGRAFAALHAIPLSLAPEGIEVVADDPQERALTRLEEGIAGLLQPSPVFSLAMRWLELNVSSAVAPSCIVHSDIRVGNLIVAADGLRAVLDWEGVRTGDPMEDPSYMTMRMWRFGNDLLEMGGFAHTSEVAAAYTAAGGTWDDERFGWWQILGTLRWGIGLAGQASAYLDGSVQDVVMAASGRRIAEQEYDMLTLIRRQLQAAGAR